MKKLALLLVSVMLSISIVACSDDDGPEVIFYIVRHAETFSNTQHGLYGFYDSPLTQRGIDATLYQKTNTNWATDGLGGIEFRAAYSSTSGRAISTARILMGYDPPSLTHYFTDPRASNTTTRGNSGRIITDPRLREINFGRFEGLIMTVLNPDPHGVGSHIGAQSSLYFALAIAGINTDPPAIEDRNYTIFNFADHINTFDGRAAPALVPFLRFGSDGRPEPISTTTGTTRLPHANNLLAEDGTMLATRINGGIRAIAEREAANGGGNVLVVAHGITIMALAHYFDSSVDPQLIDVARIHNNSVLRVRYQNGNFTILGDTWRAPMQLP